MQDVWVFSQAMMPRVIIGYLSCNRLDKNEVICVTSLLLQKRSSQLIFTDLYSYRLCKSLSQNRVNPQNLKSLKAAQNAQKTEARNNLILTTVFYIPYRAKVTAKNSKKIENVKQCTFCFKKYLVRENYQPQQKTMSYF